MFRENFLRCLPEEERKRHGKAGLLAAEATAEALWESELKEQKIFVGLLELKKSAGLLTYTHPRPDKRSTIQRGQADFLIRAQGRCLSIEFKAPGGAVMPAQAQFLRDEWAAGNPAGIVHSAAEGHTILTKWLNREMLPEEFRWST